MIAYNKTWLENLYVQKEAANARAENCINVSEQQAIQLAYPAPFYTPNIFIRIGLFILTNIILLFSLGFLSLLFLSVIEKAASGLVIFFGMLGFVALEMMIQKKNHYKSGVDDGLLWGAAIAISCGIGFQYDFAGAGNCLLVCIVSVACSIRYGDRLMAVTGFISFLGLVIFICKDQSPDAKNFLPFMIMGISLGAYVLSNKMKNRATFNVYAGCFFSLEIVSLITLYIAGNYLVVQEGGNSLFNLHYQEGQAFPFSIIFWICTTCIPLFYLFRGIQKKNGVLIRVGLLLTAVGFLTIYADHKELIAEVVMLIAGSSMVITAWILTRYLKTPKYGFTQETLKITSPGSVQIESLIIAETFSQQVKINDGTSFGGGSFGGAGSTGDF